MNGLRLIRTICNYSQATLAQELGISRQAINMWENGRKSIPEERKQQLCDFFGIQDALWLEEIDEKTRTEIFNQPIFRAKKEYEDVHSEHYFFSPDKGRYGNRGMRNPASDDIITLDEKCLLKREELKALYKRILDYANNVETENSYEALTRANRTITPISGLLDAYDSIDDQRAPLKIPFFFTVCSVIDAVNLSFGNLSREDNFNHSDNPGNILYDCSNLTLALSDLITSHLDAVKKVIDDWESAHSKARMKIVTTEEKSLN